MEVNRTGAYLLILFNPKKQPVRIGKLGKINFLRGYYFYVGSGMKNLEQRVLRHKRKQKKIRWHIDYLTKRFQFVDAKLFPSSRKLECQIAKILAQKFKMIKGFGCSDCRCQSHLFYLDRLFGKNLNRILCSMSRFDAIPTVINSTKQKA